MRSGTIFSIGQMNAWTIFSSCRRRCAIARTWPRMTDPNRALKLERGNRQIDVKAASTWCPEMCLINYFIGQDCRGGVASASSHRHRRTLAKQSWLLMVFLDFLQVRGERERAAGWTVGQVAARRRGRVPSLDDVTHLVSCLCDGSPCPWASRKPATSKPIPPCRTCVGRWPKDSP